MVTGLSATVIGQRIKQLRTRRGLTQDDLAGGEYSKSYISAIEQGKTRPSLQALQRMCTRLNVSPGLILDPNAEGFTPLDPEAARRRVRRKSSARHGVGADEAARHEYLLSNAEMLIYTGQSQQALPDLREVESAALGSGEGSGSRGSSGGKGRRSDKADKADRQTDHALLQRVYYLSALAALRGGDVSAGLEYAQKGLEAAKMVSDRTAMERLRNLVGLGHYLNDEPLNALEQHRLCLEAFRTGGVTDPNLKLQVYYNLASDYWALHDNERARATYHDALELLEQVNSMQAQAQASMAQAQHLGGMHLYSLAAPFASRAAGIHEALDNIQLVARMENRYGDILVEMGDLKGAESYLGKSLQLAETLNSEVDKALALTNLARFELKQGNLEQAEGHAQRAVQMVRGTQPTGVTGNRGRKGGPLSVRVESQRVLSKALALAGEIATQRGDAAKADRMFTEAIRILEANETIGGSEIYQKYAQTLAARGDHEQASKYYERAYHAVTRR